MLKSYLLGKEFEEKAAIWFLSHHNAKLIARNYRCFRGEIDLIFEETTPSGLEIVFVEVKVRSPQAWGSGLEAMNWKKKQSLKRAVDHFLMKYQGEAQWLRFDLLYSDGKIWKCLKGIELEGAN